MRTLKLLNLHCNKIDDNNTKVDETFITVDNGNFQGFGRVNYIFPFTKLFNTDSYEVFLT